jgi:hypothetical protein
LPSDSLESVYNPHTSSHGLAGVELTKLPLNALTSNQSNCNARTASVAADSRGTAPVNFASMIFSFYFEERAQYAPEVRAEPRKMSARAIVQARLFLHQSSPATGE